jgi:hypothetical protein
VDAGLEPHRLRLDAGDRKAPPPVEASEIRHERSIRKAPVGRSIDATLQKHRIWSSAVSRLKNVLNAMNTKSSGSSSVTVEKSPVVTAMWAPPVLLRSFSIIAGDASMPCTATPRMRQWQCESPGSNPQLQCRASTRQFRERRYRSRVVLGIERVVDIRDLIAVDAK